MREVSRTSTGVWYESDYGGFFQLPHGSPSPLARPSVAEQVEWGLRYLRERYGDSSWEAYRAPRGPAGGGL